MAAYYTYLIASLPMLHFGAKPPFSFERFLKTAAGLISGKDTYILGNLPEKDGDLNPEPANQTIKGWLNFDTALRNELVKLRVQHKHIDPLKYQHKDSFVDPAVFHLALAAHRNPSILEAEKSLDQARWQALEGLSLGHYFDADFLIVYGYKLKLLERWERINAADKAKLLQEVLAKN